MNTEVINKYTQVAFDIGAGLCRSAIWYNGRCNWLHSTTNGYGREVFNPMEYHFYEGTSGTAFFLFNLYKITGEKIFLTTAQGALNQALHSAGETTKQNTVAFYTGTSGLAYVLLKAAEQFNSNEKFEQANSFLKQIISQPYSNQQFDLMHGLAGAIPVLTYSAKFFKTEYALDVAIKYGEHLLLNAIQNKNTLSWNYQNENHLPHTGFAHGSSGMAYAFALLYKFTGDEKFKNACNKAFAYEDLFFNAEKNNWKNIEEVNANVPDDDSGKYQSLWCYGAAGMGLARLAAYSIAEDEHTKKMVLKACDVAGISISEEQNFSLCHGYFSNAELLLCAANYLNDANYVDTVVRFAELGYKTIFEKDREWPCGNKAPNPSPSFMTGTAGIGNFYLRLGYKSKIASGLILEELL